MTLHRTTQKSLYLDNFASFVIRHGIRVLSRPERSCLLSLSRNHLLLNLSRRLAVLLLVMRDHLVHVHVVACWYIVWGSGVEPSESIKVSNLALDQFHLPILP